MRISIVEGKSGKIAVVMEIDVENKALRADCHVPLDSSSDDACKWRNELVGGFDKRHFTENSCLTSRVAKDHRDPGISARVSCVRER